MIEQEGPGWRIARDPSRGRFPVLIGGATWAIELTEYEWGSLVLLLDELIAQYHQLENQLMIEESITLEIERLPWWACIDGDRHSWSLKLILQGDGDQIRGAEGFWPVPAAQAIATAMRTMWDSYQ